MPESDHSLFVMKFTTIIIFLWSYVVWCHKATKVKSQLKELQKQLDSAERERDTLIGQVREGGREGVREGGRERERERERVGGGREGGRKGERERDQYCTILLHFLLMWYLKNCGTKPHKISLTFDLTGTLPFSTF